MTEEILFAIPFLVIGLCFVIFASPISQRTLLFQNTLSTKMEKLFVVLAVVIGVYSVMVGLALAYYGQLLAATAFFIVGLGGILRAKIDTRAIANFRKSFRPGTLSLCILLTGLIFVTYGLITIIQVLGF